MKVLYLEGDACSPKYVRGALERLGLEVRGVVDEPYGGPFEGHDLCLLSDYPARLLGEGAMEALVAAVRGGMGLVVVGGWTSFGRGGYARTRVEEILPARLHGGDDRVTVPSGAFLFATAPAHPVLQGLPFDAPPVVTGWNGLEPSEDAQVVMEARPVGSVDVRAARLAGDAAPILLVRPYGAGRVAALATDLAPHWSGGWTDWGGRLVPVGEGEEVGVAYLRFVGQLCAWAAAQPLPEAARRLVARP